MEGHLEPLKSLEAGVTQSDFGRDPGWGAIKLKCGRPAPAAPAWLPPSHTSLGPQPPPVPTSPRCLCLFQETFRGGSH